MRNFTAKSKGGFTLVEIMIVVAIIALLAAIAIPNLLRAKMSANDALAKSTLRAWSTAAESYASANNGAYPTVETDLTAPAGGATPYLSKAYCDQSMSGFTFACTFDAVNAATYSVVATPVAVGQTGSAAFTIATGGVLTP